MQVQLHKRVLSLFHPRFFMQLRSDTTYQFYGCSLCELDVLDIIIVCLELDMTDCYPELEMYSDDDVWVSTPG